VAADQRHDENQIYGCLMVPVDLRRAHVPEDDLKAQVARKSWRSSWRWRLIPLPTLSHKNPTA
jgi:hypothetical protein